MRILRSICLFAVAYFLCLGAFTVSRADTVVMSDSERLKGVIVEDYGDRIVISTMEGEKQVMRKNIQRVIYDLEEQNLTSLANFYQDRGMYKEAHYYYEKALAVNPDYEKARDGLNYVGTYLRQTGRRMKMKHIQRRNEDKKWMEGVRDENPRSGKERVRETLGIELEDVEGSFKIVEVAPASPAARAGIKRRDVLLSVWGRSIKYTPTSEVMKELLTPGVMDIKVTIGRSFILNLRSGMGGYSSFVGIVFGFSEMKGLIVEKAADAGVADLAGIKKGDIVTEIQGQPTRYMSLKSVEGIINSRKGDTLSLKTKRNVVIWKKFKAEV